MFDDRKFDDRKFDRRPMQRLYFARSPVRIAVLAWALLPGSGPVEGQSYGYDKAKDPLVVGVKAAISAVRKEEWKRLRATVSALDWQVIELRSDVGVDMKPVIDRAVASREVRMVGYAMTQLVFHALLQKFHWNRTEKLEKYGRARARLQAARHYYDEILSHAVRRADAAQKTERHAKIVAAFEELRVALGSPGLFGAGRKEPNLETFTKVATTIESQLREVYPDFLSPKPDSKGTPEKSPDKPPAGPKPEPASREKKKGGRR